MNKKIIKEDIYAAIAILIPFAAWVGKKIYDTLRFSKVFGVDGEKVFKKYLQDRGFIKDLIDVIKDEGGIDDFIRKTRKLVPDKDVDDYLYSYYKGGIKNPELQKIMTGKTAPVIVYKLVAKPTFRKYVRAYKLKPEWERAAADAIHDVISSENFRAEFKKMLKNAGEDVSLADKKPPKEMTPAEKRKFFNLDGKISLKPLLPKTK
jgi:hypothetical protein